MNVVKPLHFAVPFLVLAAAPALTSAGDPCPAQSVHIYGVPAPGHDGGVVTVTDVATGGVIGFVTVADTNVFDCDGDFVPGDFDGDRESGIGGGFFGYGAWVNDQDCAYMLNVHGPNVAVNDVVFGAAIRFFVGEDDQSGPIKVQDPVEGSWACETDGAITPGPADFPGADADDCLGGLYNGVGATCGTGGGDGGYWVILVPTRGGNPPTMGTITAF